MKKKLSILLACVIAMMLLVTSLTASASAMAGDQPDNTDIKYVKYVKCRIFTDKSATTEPNYIVEPNTAHPQTAIKGSDAHENRNFRLSHVPEVHSVSQKTTLSVHLTAFYRSLNQDDNSFPKGSNPEVNSKDIKKNDDTRVQPTADITDGEIARYQAQYAKLRAKFEYMFKLKNLIEREQSVISDKWNEYYALNNIYNNELEKLAKDFAINL